MLGPPKWLILGKQHCSADETRVHLPESPRTPPQSTYVQGTTALRAAVTITAPTIISVNDAVNQVALTLRAGAAASTRKPALATTAQATTTGGALLVRGRGSCWHLSVDAMALRWRSQPPSQTGSPGLSARFSSLS